MPNIKYLRPHPDRLVRDPVTGRALGAEGQAINMDDPVRRNFFLRALRAGDVVEGRPPAPKTTAATKEDQA